MASEPDIEATVVKSELLWGYLTLKAIKDGKTVPFELVLEEQGFVPGDIVKIMLYDEYKRLKEWAERYADLRN